MIGLTAYLISIKNKPQFINNLLAVIVSGGLSIVASCAVCFAVSKLFSNKNLAYRSVFSIFYTLCTFPLFAFCCKKTFANTFDINTTAPYILLTLFIARIGCSIEGCCQGTIYAATIEELLCLTGFVLMMTNKIKKSFLHFFIAYMIWRFFAEFFKESYKIELVGFFSLIQYVAILATLISSIVLIKKEKNYEKQ